MWSYLQLLFLSAVLPYQSLAEKCTHLINPGFEQADKPFHPTGWNTNYETSDNPFCQRSAYYPYAGKNTLQAGTVGAIGLGYAEQSLKCMDTTKSYKLQLHVGHTMCVSYDQIKCFPPFLNVYLDGVLLRSTPACGPKSIPCVESTQTAHFWTLQIGPFKPKTARPLLRFEWEFAAASGYYYSGLIDNVQVLEL